MLHTHALPALVSLALSAACAPAADAAGLNLNGGVIVTPASASPMVKLAARMISEEVAKRSGVKLPVAAEEPKAGPVIVLRTGSGGANPEGYHIVSHAVAGRARIVVTGASDRGVMFGAGRLLRLLACGTDKVEAPAIGLSSAPAKAIRGHQLGWRPTANSYDRWGLKEFEQYLRDLVVWGVNAIELIPFDTQYDRARNLDFTCKLADLVHSYGMQVWLWYGLDDVWPREMAAQGVTPGEPVCPSKPLGRKYILSRRSELFKAMRHLDAVFVPGGDPAGCPCGQCKPWVRTMLPVCAEITAIMKRYHPNAQMWVSNQGFKGPDNDWFYEYLNKEQPRWLAGLAAGPWAEETLPAMRARTPKRYPIRLYPDICHTVRCQYPAREWDQAWALTLNREPPMFRPDEHARIARLYLPFSVGAGTYSDGVTDDLNKAVWSAVLWDAEATTDDILRDYARWYFGEAAAPRVVQGLRGLEAAWRGSVAANEGIEATLALWRSIGEEQPSLQANWRYQMALTTATYHAYVRRRLLAGKATEAKVYAALRAGVADSAEAGVPVAIGKALDIIEASDAVPVEPEMKQELLRLGGRMFKSIGMQMSVPLWGASGTERGAIMDALDQALWDRDWIKAELTKLLPISATPTLLAGVQHILNWEDPGPGGFYDNLGDAGRQPHLVHQKAWADDPGYVESPRCDFRHTQPGDKLSWAKYAETLYGSPLIMRYTGLDPNASYKVRAVYSGRYKPTMTLTANGRIKVHGPVATPAAPVPQEWPIPREATASGTLELRWDRSVGRGAQVSEVWLIKE